jgi:hypothetical protein
MEGERRTAINLVFGADNPVQRCRTQFERMIEDASAASLHGFVQECTEPGSTIHADSWQGYVSLENKCDRREITKVPGRGKRC